MSETASAELPLSRYKVLDLTVARAGPVAVRLLADWGAKVIRVDAPAGKDRGSLTGKRRGSDEQNMHRNKRSVCIDLKTPSGSEVLKRLIAQSDVVVENFRAPVKQRLGLTYEQLKHSNPRIILASISGFGQDGPYSERPAVDQVIQGMSGLMSVTGQPDHGPMRVGIAISDTAAGMFLGQGILLALLHREHTGQGQWVHTSLFESMLNKLDFQAARYTVSGETPGPQGNGHPTQAPMGAFKSLDGMVNISAHTDRMWLALCDAVDCAALRDHPNYQTHASRLAHRQQLCEDIDKVTQRFTSAELVKRLTAAGVASGPIYDIGQAFEDPQAKHLRMTRPAMHNTLGAVNLIRSPINLSAFPHPERFHHAGPDPGEHSRAILQELGYDASAIDRMTQEGAVS